MLVSKRVATTYIFDGKSISQIEKACQRANLGYGQFCYLCNIYRTRVIMYYSQLLCQLSSHLVTMHCFYRESHYSQLRRGTGSDLARSSIYACRRLVTPLQHQVHHNSCNYNDVPSLTDGNNSILLIIGYNKHSALVM